MQKEQKLLSKTRMTAIPYIEKQKLLSNTRMKAVQYAYRKLCMVPFKIYYLGPETQIFVNERPVYSSVKGCKGLQLRCHFFFGIS